MVTLKTDAVGRYVMDLGGGGTHPVEPGWLLDYYGTSVWCPAREGWTRVGDAMIKGEMRGELVPAVRVTEIRQDGDRMTVNWSAS